jgi:hypothetical protein
MCRVDTARELGRHGRKCRGVIFDDGDRGTIGHISIDFSWRSLHNAN